MNKVMHKKRQERNYMVSKRLKQLMKQKKLDAEDLSRLSGVDLQRIKRIESGESLVNVVNAIRISKALGCSVEKVFGGE